MSEIDDIFGRKKKNVEPAKQEKKDIEKKEIPLKSESKVSKKKKEFKVPQKIKEKVQVETVDFSTNAEIKKPKIVDPNDDGTFADSREQTEDGLPIYLDTELNVGLDGGDTPQCPFDCQCCF
ncbi:hypothetical protein HK103_004666 [Boothiomyces macroporosus]|uniref:DUF1764 domain-containing protein n=1 Tax=Boothiomyces macroporosus TaxID=261099 RepID=A0AAD5ULU8_9FUNG|nr:hypothetical protein HK103_004666 [Boothiomyces macroporosus]